MGEQDLLSATKENYERFLDKFTHGLKGMDYPGLSFMGYGSVFRNKYTPGISDIDGILVFPENIVTDKSRLREVSDIIAFALEHNPIVFQLFPTDKGIIKYPLFNALGSAWEGYLPNETKIILGPDYRPEMKCRDQIPPEAHSIAWNLKKTRTKFLFARYNQDTDYDRFFKGFMSALKSPTSFPKYMHYLMTGKFVADRFSTIDFLKETLPNLDVEPLQKIKKVYSNADYLKKLRDKPEEIIDFWEEIITFFESAIKEFVKKDLKLEERFQ